MKFRASDCPIPPFTTPHSPIYTIRYNAVTTCSTCLNSRSVSNDCAAPHPQSDTIATEKHGNGALYGTASQEGDACYGPSPDSPLILRLTVQRPKRWTNRVPVCPAYNLHLGCGSRRRSANCLGPRPPGAPFTYKTARFQT